MGSRHPDESTVVGGLSGPDLGSGAPGTQGIPEQQCGTFFKSLRLESSLKSIPESFFILQNMDSQIYSGIELIMVAFCSCLL